jgi:hypothetical protein
MSEDHDDRLGGPCLLIFNLALADFELAEGRLRHLSLRAAG